MLRRSGHSPRGSRKILLAIIGCALLVVALILLAKLRTTNTHSELESKARAVTAAAEERQNQQRAAADQARAALPPDAPISRDWTLDACLQAINANAMSPGLHTVLQAARELLSNEDLAPEEPLNGGRGQRTSTLNDLKAKIALARQAGNITPLEEMLDMERHPRDEVLAGIDRYLCGLTPIQEAETAYEKGLFVAQATPFARPPRTPISDYTLAEALAYRAVFDARRGETDKALHSYLNALAMQRTILDTRNGFTQPDLWFLQRIADSAWTRTPFSQEQRDRVLARLGTAATPERLMDIMYANIELERKNRDTALAAMSKEPLGFIGRLVINYQWSRSTQDYDSCMKALPLLFAQPLSEALPSMENFAARYPSGKNNFQTGPRMLMTRAARLHVQNALAGAAPDVVRTAFALKDYRRAHGEYPRTLDGVSPDPIPALPFDTLTAQPLVYQSDGKTFTITLPQTRLDASASKFKKDLSSLTAHGAQLWLALE